MKTGFVALLVGCPIAIVAAVLWWKVTLAISAVTVLAWAAGRIKDTGSRVS